MFQSRSAYVYGPLASVINLEEKNNVIKESASIGVLNMQAKKGDDSICHLQNGDQLIVYQESALGKSFLAEKESSKLLHMWRTVQKKELFNKRKKITKAAQAVFDRDPKNFFYGVGCLKKNTVPLHYQAAQSFSQYFKPELTLPPEKEIITGKEPENIFSDYLQIQLAQNTALQEQMAGNRNDILYHGIVELDDQDYYMDIEIGPDTYEFSYHGLQKGFMPAAWGILLYSGHQSLVIRPEPGIA